MSRWCSATRYSIASGIAYYDLFNLDGIIGDKQTVNGKIQPFFEVKKRRYRLRFLNTGPSRFYTLKFSNNMPFWQISNDGNLLPKPIQRTSINLTVAERVDIIVDFSQATGSEIYSDERPGAQGRHRPDRQHPEPRHATPEVQPRRGRPDGSLPPNRSPSSAICRSWTR